MMRLSIGIMLALMVVALFGGLVAAQSTYQDPPDELDDSTKMELLDIHELTLVVGETLPP